MPDVSLKAEPQKRSTFTASERLLPLGLRCLVYLTTSRWQPPAPAHPSIAALARAMLAEGWILRGAWQRNYVLWRNGRTMQEACLPLIVLPLSLGRLSALQLNIFLAVELAAARAGPANRLQRGSPVDGNDVLETIMAAIASDLGVSVAEPHRLHREARDYLESHGRMMK